MSVTSPTDKISIDRHFSEKSSSSTMHSHPSVVSSLATNTSTPAGNRKAQTDHFSSIPVITIEGGEWNDAEDTPRNREGGSGVLDSVGSGVFHVPQFSPTQFDPCEIFLSHLQTILKEHHIEDFENFVTLSDTKDMIEAKLRTLKDTVGLVPEALAAQLMVQWIQMCVSLRKNLSSFSMKYRRNSTGTGYIDPSQHRRRSSGGSSSSAPMSQLILGADGETSITQIGSFLRPPSFRRGSDVVFASHHRDSLVSASSLSQPPSFRESNSLNIEGGLLPTPDRRHLISNTGGEGGPIPMKLESNPETPVEKPTETGSNGGGGAEVQALSNELLEGKERKGRLNDYVVFDVIGRGAYSIVYLAVHQQTREVRAIKRISRYAFMNNNNARSKKQRRSVVNVVDDSGEKSSDVAKTKQHVRQRTVSLQSEEGVSTLPPPPAARRDTDAFPGMASQEQFGSFDVEEEGEEGASPTSRQTKIQQQESKSSETPSMHRSSAVSLEEGEDDDFEAQVPDLSRDDGNEEGGIAETTIMQRLHHRHIMPLHQVINDRKHPFLYLVLAHAANGPIVQLDDYGRCKPISHVRLPRLMRQISAAILYLHRHGVVHRDLKPDNILLTQHDMVLISDFGVSEHAVSLAIKGQRGTPVFFAPEIFQQDGNIGREDEEEDPISSSASVVNGEAVDMWAIGITFFAMKFGYLPFNGSTAAEIKNSVLHDEIRFPSDVAPRWESFFKWILSKEVKYRMNASELYHHAILIASTHSNRFVSQMSERTQKTVRTFIEKLRRAISGSREEVATGILHAAEQTKSGDYTKLRLSSIGSSTQLPTREDSYETANSLTQNMSLTSEAADEEGIINRTHSTVITLAGGYEQNHQLLQQLEEEANPVLIHPPSSLQLKSDAGSIPHHDHIDANPSVVSSQKNEAHSLLLGGHRGETTTQYRPQGKNPTKNNNTNMAMLTSSSLVLHERLSSTKGGGTSQTRLPPMFTFLKPPTTANPLCPIPELKSEAGNKEATALLHRQEQNNMTTSNSPTRHHRLPPNSSFIAGLHTGLLASTPIAPMRKNAELFHTASHSHPARAETSLAMLQQQQKKVNIPDFSSGALFQPTTSGQQNFLAMTTKNNPNLYATTESGERKHPGGNFLNVPGPQAPQGWVEAISKHPKLSPHTQHSSSMLVMDESVICQRKYLSPVCGSGHPPSIAMAPEQAPTNKKEKNRCSQPPQKRTTNQDDKTPNTTEDGGVVNRMVSRDVHLKHDEGKISPYLESITPSSGGEKHDASLSSNFHHRAPKDDAAAGLRRNIFSEKVSM